MCKRRHERTTRSRGLSLLPQNYQMVYMIMEYIKHTPFPVPDHPERVALALQWLRDLPAPPGRLSCLGAYCCRCSEKKIGHDRPGIFY
jgi:hypothetical protein